ncbi:MAG: hypothetical protein Q7K43_02560 [Candidatus Woesearchaeota archaeon]|nr:hypothetical protein [Candidatus Woesearchaeota archaeon]
MIDSVVIILGVISSAFGGLFRAWIDPHARTKGVLTTQTFVFHAITGVIAGFAWFFADLNFGMYLGVSFVSAYVLVDLISAFVRVFRV